MKNWKQYTLIVFMAFFVFAFIGCGDDDGKKDPCNCDPKDHLAIDENCGCGLADCDCTAKVYGYAGGKPIYRLGVVDDADAETAAEKIVLAWGDIEEYYSEFIDDILSKVNKVYITSGDSLAPADSNGVVVIGEDASVFNIRGVFLDSMAQLQQSNSVRMAGGKTKKDGKQPAIGGNNSFLNPLVRWLLI